MVSKARDIGRRLVKNEYAILVAVLIGVVAGIAGLTKGVTLRPANVINVLLQSSITGVAAIGQALVMLTAGIDVSIGGVGLLCTNIGAGLLTLDSQNTITGYSYPVPLVILAMMLIGTCFGLVNGLIVSRFKVPALVVTLGMWQIAQGSAFIVNQGRAVGQLPESLAPLGLFVGGVPVLGIVFISVAVLVYFILIHTTYGRSIYAVGSNPFTAWLSGIRTNNIILSVYALSGLMAGIAASMETARLISASMESLKGVEIDSIAAASVGGVSLLGGQGNIIGVVLGVLIIGFVNNGLSALGAAFGVKMFVIGAILFGAVAVDYLRRR